MLMNVPMRFPNRRIVLGSIACGAAFFMVRGLFAEGLKLVRTPPREEGPFYPDKLSLDIDNDLLIINDAITPLRDRARTLHQQARGLSRSVVLMPIPPSPVSVRR